MPNEIVRLYHMADGEMLVIGGATLKQFVVHKDAFYEFAPDHFNERYLAGFIAAEAAAHGAGVDAVVRGRQTLETGNVDLAFDECVDAYDDFTYFLDKAYPDAPHRHNQFGVAEYSHAKKSVARFVLFMESVAGSTALHRTELVTLGCREAILDRLAAASDRLSLCKVTQKEAIRTRQSSTTVRVDLLNAFWLYLDDIDDASKRVFRRKSELRKLFRLPDHPSRKTDDDGVKPNA